MLWKLISINLDIDKSNLFSLNSTYGFSSSLITFIVAEVLVTLLVNWSRILLVLFVDEFQAQNCISQGLVIVGFISFHCVIKYLR